METTRYELIVELFAILADLAEDGLSRNQLRQLQDRAVSMLITFEEIGPLQEHTNMFHLIIELVKQAIRWGPPSSVWCYMVERIMGHLVRGIKSKRHAEANIMSRYRSTLVPCHALNLPRFSSLNDVLSQTARSAPVDKFPSRARDGAYLLTPKDFEDLHLILLAINSRYRRVARESGLIHGITLAPGLDIQNWRPWLAPVYRGSSTWLRRNSLTLASAVTAFNVPRVKIAYSGVFHGGDRRTGSKTTVATSDYAHAYSMFSFKEGSATPGRLGKILFMFKLEFAKHVMSQQVLEH